MKSENQKEFPGDLLEFVVRGSAGARSVPPADAPESEARARVEEEPVEADTRPARTATLRDQLEHDRDLAEMSGGVASLRPEDFRAILDADSEPVVVIDVAKRILFANEVFGKILGRSIDELRGQEITSTVHSDDASDLDEIASEVNRGGAPGGSTVRFRKADGSWRKCYVIPRAFVSRAGDRCVVLRGVTTGEVSSHFGPLTGMLDSELLVERVDRILERARKGENGQFALLVIGIDRFTVINVQHGWAAGNEVLRIVADRLSLNLRPGDLMARVGGDRFCVLLDRLPRAGDEVSMAERLEQVVGEPFRLGSEEISLSVSIGVASSDGGFEQAEEMVDAATAAMAEAKKRSVSVFAHTGSRATPVVPAAVAQAAAVDEPSRAARLARGRRFIRSFGVVAGLVAALTLALWLRPVADHEAKVSEAGEPAAAEGQVRARSRTRAQPSPAGSLPVEPSGPTAESRPVAARLALELQATDEVWVRISVDGSLRLDAVLTAGQSYSFEGDRTAELQVGNAGGLTVVWNGSDLGSLGRPGEVRRLYFTPTEVGRGRLPPGESD